MEYGGLRSALMQLWRAAARTASPTRPVVLHQLGVLGGIQSGIYVRMYVCVYIFIYIYIFIYLFVYLFIYIRVHMYISI